MLQIIFTVPNCVGLTCGCQELLPNLQIKSEFLINGDISINWKLNSNYSRSSAYIIRYN